jgi:hypothetical protein
VGVLWKPSSSGSNCKVEASCEEARKIVDLNDAMLFDKRRRIKNLEIKDEELKVDCLNGNETAA